MTDRDGQRKGSGGIAWFFAPLAILIAAGVGFSIAAYVYAEPPLSPVEAVGAGFGALGGVIVALIFAIVGIVTAGGALVVTLFFVASPIIAIVLFILLMRRSRYDGPSRPAGPPVR